MGGVEEVEREKDRDIEGKTVKDRDKHRQRRSGRVLAILYRLCVSRSQ